MLIFAGQYGLTNKSKLLIEKGGRVGGITLISATYLRVVRELLNIGEDVRHVDEYRGEFMLVAETVINTTISNAMQRPIGGLSIIISTWFVCSIFLRHTQGRDK